MAKSLDKIHRNLKLHKQIERAMKDPRYVEAERKKQEQAVLNALARFCFISLMYLEVNFGCKKAGLSKFIGFVLKNVREIGEDEEYLTKSNEYYIETHGLDVMASLGMRLDG